jgi:hypothetical protein
MCWSAATAASAAAASGSTKLLRSGIFVFARRLACARRRTNGLPSRARCDARARLYREREVRARRLGAQPGAAIVCVVQASYLARSNDIRAARRTSSARASAPRLLVSYRPLANSALAARLFTQRLRGAAVSVRA